MNDYTAIIQALISISPVPVIFSVPRAGIDGYFHMKEKRIVIRSSLSLPKTVHVFLHELTHALTWEEPNISCDTAELIAESVSLIAMEWLNITVDNYLYLLKYNSDLTLPEFHQHAHMIQKTARFIIESLKERGIRPCTTASDKR